ncbi:chaplin [Streptomyces sp. LN704]|uniref:chaplin n=1 Tax=Streptomyces sp. LN704 TaxID=3112982 RepID=UPI00371E75A0
MPAHADSAAHGGTAGSPGLISGDTIQLPVHVPVNACGNTVNVAGLLNPAAGNSCAEVSDGGAVRGADGGSRRRRPRTGHGRLALRQGRRAHRQGLGRGGGRGALTRKRKGFSRCALR